MRIKIRSLQGEEYIVEVQNDQTVSHLKSSLSEKANGLPVDRLKLVHKGRTMQDPNLISEYNLEEDCKVHLIVQKDSGSVPSTSDTAPCPMDTMSSSRTIDTATTSDKSSESREKSQFEIILRARLLKTFTSEQVDKIVANVRQEINEDINSSSLDDLERLAKQKLNISND